jgi:hypothetical protein
MGSELSTNSSFYLFRATTAPLSINFQQLSSMWSVVQKIPFTMPFTDLRLDSCSSIGITRNMSLWTKVGREICEKCQSPKFTHVVSRWSCYLDLCIVAHSVGLVNACISFRHNYGVTATGHPISRGVRSSCEIYTLKQDFVVWRLVRLNVTPSVSRWPSYLELCIVSHSAGLANTYNSFPHDFDVTPTVHSVSRLEREAFKIYSGLSRFELSSLSISVRVHSPGSYLKEVS